MSSRDSSPSSSSSLTPPPSTSSSESDASTDNQMNIEETSEMHQQTDNPETNQELIRPMEKLALTDSPSVSSPELSSAQTSTMTAATDQSTNQPIPEYNILLLGETGAGKSTTINALANYFNSKSFEEAANSDFIEMVPSEFTLPDQETGESIIIKSGNDANEQPGDGRSSTQSPVGYTFRSQQVQFKLIDTPGMGDTSGVQADKDNFDKILNYLQGLEELHAIVFILKSNETRKTATFCYVINQLLTHLHKSATRNIIFLFTYSRNTLYGPGEGFTTLKSFLNQELKDVDIQLKSGVNVFYIDNEAYRFLVAQKKGYRFKPNQEKSYIEAWNESVSQTIQMFNKIMELPPHNLRDTCNLNEARKVILQLAQPMVELQGTISDNIAHIKTQKTRIDESNKNIQELVKSLYLEVDEAEARELMEPMTVCTSAKCRKWITFQGDSQVDYKQVCHRSCRLKNVEVNTIGHPDLRYCDAMGGKHNCQACDCPYELHMHKMMEYVKVKKVVINQAKQKEKLSEEKAQKLLNEAVAKMSQLVAENEAELKTIKKISSYFAYILISYSNTPYNRYMEPYLDLLIDAEHKKVGSIPNYPREKYDSLVQMKAAHKEEVQVLMEAIKNKSQAPVTIADIKHYQKELIGLKHSGPQFAQILSVSEAVKKKKHQEYFEKPIVHLSQDSSPMLNSAHKFITKTVGKMYGKFQKMMTAGGSADEMDSEAESRMEEEKEEKKKKAKKCGQKKRH